MFLTSKKEVVEIVRSKKIYIIANLCVGALVAFGWILCRYYDDSAAADSHDAIVTIQQIKDDNQSARDDISDARNEISSAQQQLDRASSHLDTAANRAGELQDRVRQDKAIIDECQQLVDKSRRDAAEASRIFTDVDRANKAAGAQAGSVAPST